MEVIKINALNRISHDLSLIPLNLQDNLILWKGGVIGMFHEGHKTARLFPEANLGSLMRRTEIKQLLEGFDVQYKGYGGFVLSEWTGDGHETCGEIIYNSNQ